MTRTRQLLVDEAKRLHDDNASRGGANSLWCSYQLSKRLVLWVVVIIWVALASGCSPTERRIEGQVFIVTKSGESVKLGLVTICLLTEEQAEGMATNAFNDMQRDIEETQSSIPKLKERIQIANANAKRIQSEYEKASTAAQYATEKGEFGYSWEGARDLQRPAFTSYDLQTLQAARQNYATQKAAGTFNSIGFVTAEQDLERLETEQRDRSRSQRLWDQWRPVYVARVKECDTLAAQGTNIAQEVANVNAATAKRKGTLDRWSESGGVGYWEYVPNAPVTTTKTDADGKFSLVLPEKGRFAVAARAGRLLANTEERYCWIVWITDRDLKEKKIVLSNDNMIGSNPSESVVIEIQR